MWFLFTVIRVKNNMLCGSSRSNDAFEKKTEISTRDKIRAVYYTVVCPSKPRVVYDTKRRWSRVFTSYAGIGRLEVKNDLNRSTAARSVRAVLTHGDKRRTRARKEIGNIFLRFREEIGAETTPHSGDRYIGFETGVRFRPSPDLIILLVLPLPHPPRHVFYTAV